MRLNNRSFNEIRPIKITRHYTKHAEGSVLIEFGDTKYSVPHLLLAVYLDS